MIISIIIPTLNEEKNIFKLYDAIKKKFKCKKYEIIYVDDDSSDKTQYKILSLKKQKKNVKYIFRKEKNLSTAFLDGVKISKGKYVVLMDADLQHSPSDINKLYNEITKNNLDIVIGSRFLKNSSNYSKSIKSIVRLSLSKIFISLINLLFGLNVTDPLAGFFISKKKSLKNNKHLYKKGFKILLDYLIVNRKELKTKDIPINVNKRLHGNSKLNLKIFYLFLKQCFFYLSK
ncbi:glycosyltransferase [Candidatus Pelagibacter sp.]|jgi:dolichol-phosphate mannosyltransferase|nr:glycosyltransferase [Candidatus Pelagibacter sp.]